MLTHFRFDLVPKLLYAKYREENINTGFALDLYREHLRVWNGFKEYDNPDKNTFEKFKESFDNLLDSMKMEGFKEEFAVPVTKEGHLLNGAHRVAAAMTHRVPIKTRVSTNPRDGQVNCSSEFFRQLGLGEKWLDAMALHYALMGSGLKIITMFPARDSSKDSIAEDIINNSVPVVYKKTFNVNDRGLFNLISQLYFGEPWLSDGVDPLVGAKLKANVCRGSAPVKVFLVQSPPEDLKEKIRDVYGIEKHSAHINDTDVETQRIARIVFNNNSINFLNNGTYFYSYKLVELLDVYRKTLDANSIDPESFCITGSAIMTMFGLRECADLDYLHLDPALTLGGDGLRFPWEKMSFAPLINSHETELKKYPLHKHDILSNPYNHFFFNDIKFATLDVVKALKANRAEEKDLVDVKLMEQVLCVN